MTRLGVGPPPRRGPRGFDDGGGRGLGRGSDPDILKRLRDGGRPKEERRRAVA